ncbi:DUF2304 domain-containing protein [Actinomyces sp.]|uniref:DUF2304 domain-containing protein n=1 Tax=Actinomyces sp. TaxID=29317 RepID=UPI0026DAC7A2|nr:DUF2304 domain-containing protein [Actinomyces sp.]MDO4899387.1 DUF2304 domain-containing protein [Actinomyces sp.]
MGATQIFFVAIAGVIMLFVISLLRSRKLREKYAALWILVGLAILVLSLAPDLLGAIAGLLGIQVPSNLLFALAILLLLGVSLHLSLEISRLEDETRVLAENVAVLRLIDSYSRLDRKLGRPGDSHPGQTDKGDEEDE